ncbi:hypothetical protein MPSEU_000533600 [Mayamaea pseudoterrestris]|nr:hypothetical protein MPSEU_000533600 [Mayamaea pseudoterrestris]
MCFKFSLTSMALLLLHTATTSWAFSIQASSVASTGSRLMNKPLPLQASNDDSVSLADREYAEPGRNPDRPELPELKGDFDWDAKFASDDDWITENVPGKVVLSDIEIAEQVTALGKLEDAWRRRRQEDEWDAEKQVGFVTKAELLNGRTAMFFLVTGLLTELWTGVSLPGQVEELLRVGGFIGYD